MKKHIRLTLFIAMLLISTMPLSGFYIASAEIALHQSGQEFSEWTRDLESGCFVYYEDNGTSACRPASEEEARTLVERDQTLPLKAISTEGEFLQAAGMMNIILRGTPQLDGFPQAKNAFLRAAAQWGALVRADITVVIDVDFGPTRFGVPYPLGVLGSADSQQLGSADGYADARAALIASAGDDDELALYNALPQASVPTDLGNTSRLFAPSAALRALGLIGRVADPAVEQGQFGPPPSIGFNSSFDFDFDPSDGVTAGQIDFETVAAHEVGHVLGFASFVGAKELNPAMDVSLSIWDIFRLRPGAAAAALSPASFNAAQRILSSGGEQVFFAGGEELRLSTGRPDATGGDGFQASHWKNNNLTGITIGIMDPDIAPGERQTISDNDLKVLNRIGYGAEQADEGGPKLKRVTFNGSRLTIKGSGLTREVQIVVNFVVVPPLAIKGNSKKLKINGTQAEFNLRSGANIVQVIRDGLRSNIAVLNL